MIVTCKPSRAPLLGVSVSPMCRAAPSSPPVDPDSRAKQERDAAPVAASVVVADHTAQCARVGEVHHATSAGQTTVEDVCAESGAIVAGRQPGRRSETDVVVFDSTGTALQDVAAAAAAYERARGGTGAGV